MSTNDCECCKARFIQFELNNPMEDAEPTSGSGSSADCPAEKKSPEASVCAYWDGDDPGESVDVFDPCGIHRGAKAGDCGKAVWDEVREQYVIFELGKVPFGSGSGSGSGSGNGDGTCPEESVNVLTGVQRDDTELLFTRARIDFLADGCVDITSVSPLRVDVCDCNGSGSGSSNGGGNGGGTCVPICGATYNGNAMTAGDTACGGTNVLDHHADASSIYQYDDAGTTRYLFYVPDSSECAEGGGNIYTATCVGGVYNETKAGCCDEVWTDNQDGTLTLNGTSFTVENCGGTPPDCPDICAVTHKGNTMTKYADASAAPDCFGDALDLLYPEAAGMEVWYYHDGSSGFYLWYGTDGGLHLTECHDDTHDDSLTDCDGLTDNGDGTFSWSDITITAC